MLSYSDIHPDKKAFIFEFDGVLYPEREFYLQVYYLFANFIEYVETVPPATDLLELMKKVYEIYGPAEVFNRVRDAFGLDEKYRENFDRLHHSAQFPLKLELYPEMRTLLQAMVKEAKPIFIWTTGIPEGQLNKIRQTEWGNLAKQLRVYFAEEYDEPTIALKTILQEQQLNPEQVLFIGSETTGIEIAKLSGLDFLSVKHFLNS